MKRSHEIDMTNGPILSKILIFALPLMMTGILQLLFNAADMIVVGKFSGSLALAAVGSTSSLINLLVNVFIGISTGANVLAARYFGSRNDTEMRKCVHTAITLSGILGIIVCIIGLTLSGPMLRMMNTDPEVLPLSTLYLKIYFLGVPATVVYNFGAAILRAIGDTDRPLRFLTVSGITNVLLNLITVVGFHMSVAGVAIATAASQYVAALLVILCLMKSEGVYKIEFKRLGIHKDMLLQILMIGVPAGLQSAIFSISNVIIQSTINSFGSAVMAGNSAASNLEGFIYTAMNSFHHAGLCFTSQNIGARKFERLNKIAFCCISCVILFGASLSALAFVFRDPLLSLYISSNDASLDAVLAAGITRMRYICVPYFICGMMDVASGILRGLGKAWTPLIISTLGACVLRIVWIYTIFPLNPTLDNLFLSYPISWALTVTAHCIAIYLSRRKMAPKTSSI